MTDHALDLRALARHLRVRKYGVIGTSGGGPYALACAHSLPTTELRSVGVIVGMGPIELGVEEMRLANHIIFPALSWTAWLLRSLVGWPQGLQIPALNRRIEEEMFKRISSESF